MKVSRAVVLAAGFGTRMLPVTKAVPKELLPLVDTPVIHYIVEELVNSGIEHIVMVTSSGKRAVEDYFGRVADLEATLEAKPDRSASSACSGRGRWPRSHLSDSIRWEELPMRLCRRGAQSAMNPSFSCSRTTSSLLTLPPPDSSLMSSRRRVTARSAWSGFQNPARPLMG